MRETRWLAALVAEETVERRADSIFAPLRLQHPRLGEERRSMAHVLPMAAGELGDPLALFILVEADDRPLHGLVYPPLIAAITSTRESSASSVSSSPRDRST